MASEQQLTFDVTPEQRAVISALRRDLGAAIDETPLTSAQAEELIERLFTARHQRAAWRADEENSG